MSLYSHAHMYLRRTWTLPQTMIGEATSSVWQSMHAPLEILRSSSSEKKRVASTTIHTTCCLILLWIECCDQCRSLRTDAQFLLGRGAWNTIMWLLLMSLISHGVTDRTAQLMAFVAACTLPRRLGGNVQNLADAFSKSRWTSSKKAKYFKCTASDALTLYSIVAAEPNQSQPCQSCRDSFQPQCALVGHEPK